LSDIEFTDVEQWFSPGGIAVRCPHLRVSSGQFSAVVGPSGCGKSTLLRMVAGLLNPSKGEVQLEESTVERGFVFQDATLVPWRTAWENVCLPLELRGRSTRQMNDAIADVLGLVGLTPEDFGKYPRMLSGGMKMRVSLARALIVNPAILLFDEPFAALDDLLRQQLNEKLLEIWALQNWTTLFVTHNIAEAVYLSQRVLVMSGRPGQVVADLQVPFDYPRRRELRSSPEFAALCGEVMSYLSGVASP